MSLCCGETENTAGIFEYPINPTHETSRSEVMMLRMGVPFNIGDFDNKYISDESNDGFECRKHVVFRNYRVLHMK
jgi:hypothetical protein